MSAAMAESSASYIRLVQHLIEECIILKMSKEDCAEALSKHAHINPIITSTVWKELEKENKEYFEEYARRRRSSTSPRSRDGEAMDPAPGPPPPTT